MTAWESLVENSKDLATQAAGTALDTYAKKLVASNEKPASAEPPKKSLGAPTSTLTKVLIGLAIATGVGALIYFFNRKK